MKLFNPILYLLVSITFITACKKKTKTEKYANNNSTTSCLASSSWFHIDPTTGKRKTPAPQEGKASVFGDNFSVSNCDFHQWSWQKFLWLTNDVSGEPLFMKKLIQVNSHNTPITGPEITLSSKDNIQATGDILRSNKSFSTDNNSYDVYYSIHVNDSLHNTILKYYKMPGSTYTDATFPVGSLELKVAWVNAKAIKDTSNYFLTNVNLNGVPNTKMALLGMHVVGVVYNHPEFIWATFEHDDLAPYFDWKTTTTSSDAPVTSMTNKLLFKQNDTATIANLASHYNDPSKDSSNVFAVNRYGVPRKVKTASSESPFLTTSQDGAENYNNIDSINKSVKSKLKDIWGNYFYNGSIWIDTELHEYPKGQAKLLNKLGDNLYESSPGKLTRGSVAAYNITMETFEQLGFNSPPLTAIHQQSAATVGNCFSCHSSNDSPLTISHLFKGAVSKHNGLSIEETKQTRINETLDFIKNMK